MNTKISIVAEHQRAFYGIMLWIWTLSQPFAPNPRIGILKAFKGDFGIAYLWCHTSFAQADQAKPNILQLDSLI